MRKKVCLVLLASSLLVSGTLVIGSQANAADPKNLLQVESPHSDEAPKSKLLKGGLQETEPYAIGPSNKPFLQGNVTKQLPFDWSGTWQGGVRLDQLSGRATNDALQGENIEVLLKLDTAKEGKTAFDLKVRQLESEIASKEIPATAHGGRQDPDPDIHYWRDGSVSHLDIKNGATMSTSGSMVIGGRPGETAQVTISGHGSLVVGGGALGSGNAGVQRSTVTGTQGDTDYNNGAIYTTGATQYHGGYFKADDAIAVNQANIHANRIDIGNSSVSTGGRSVSVTGNNQSGMLLSQLSGGGAYLSPNQVSGPDQTVVLMNQNAQTEIVHVAPSVYDVKSASSLTGPNGRYGTQSITMRLTAYSADRIMVQMTIENFDMQNKLTNTFTTSGYLRRQ
jgi:hypothetical protein